ncbi:MAG: two-component regulator propeller domain-containing protein [Bacteroidales bacterium]
MITIKTKYYVLPAHLFRYCLLVVILFSFPKIKAQIELSHFDGFSFYTEEKGLPSTYITDIAEDKYGFLWIGTANGVSRYDGNQFTNFVFYSDNSPKQKLGFVNDLIMDKSGDRLWIACAEGILFTSIDTVKFQRIDELFIAQNLSAKNTHELFTDGENKLWALHGKNGLYCYDLKNKSHDQFVFNDDQSNSDSKLNSLQCVDIDPNDSTTLWIGSLAGLIKFNIISKDYKVFVYKNNPENAQNYIRRVQASESEVYLGSWKKGLIIFNKKTEQFNQPLIEKFPNSHLLIHHIFKEQGNQIWITSDDGLIQYNLKYKSITEVKDHNRESGLFRGISYIDSRGIIWFGFSKGLFKYDSLDIPNKFIELEKRNKIQNPLLIREIILSNDFVYVAGQFSSGLYKINMSDGSIEVITIPIFNYHNEMGSNLMDMVEMGNGKFLLISDKKIAIYNEKTQKVFHSPLQINHPNPSLQTVIKDKNNQYWIGTRAAGLSVLNFDKKTIRTFKDEFSVYRDDNSRWINNLFIDSKNKLWIGKGSSSVLDLNNFELHLLDPENTPEIKTYQDVDEFYEDKSGKVWMAGGANGFGYTNFENFTNGINHQIDGYFSGVYPLDDSLLWLIGVGLGRFNTITSTYHPINLNFNNKIIKATGPVLQYNNEQFIIGCDNGILIYNNKKQSTNPEKPIPYISSIESNGKLLYKGNSLTKSQFNLKQGTEFLKINISSLGFHFSEQRKYQYKLTDDWQDVGSNQEINLTNLSYGNYNLALKAINSNGVSRKDPTQYIIHIPSPWWVRWWAFLIYIGIAVLLADRFYRFQLSKRLAIAETIKLKEINKLKNSFYTNITHEFRTPLTVILGMVDSLRSVFENKKYEGCRTFLRHD